MKEKQPHRGRPLRTVGRKTLAQNNAGLQSVMLPFSEAAAQDVAMSHRGHTHFRIVPPVGRR